MGAKWTIGVATARTLSACGDAQTGADYPGEPLMQLQGRITSVGEQLDSGAVPGLSFDMNGTKWDTKTHFVAGEVEGTFPSELTMRVYERPPDEVSSDAPIDIRMFSVPFGTTLHGP